MKLVSRMSEGSRQCDVASRRHLTGVAIKVIGFSPHVGDELVELLSWLFARAFIG